MNDSKEDAYILKSYLVDGAQRSIQDTLSKLMFIAKFKKDLKVDVHALTLCKNSWWTSLYRTIFSRGASREEVLEFCRVTVAKAFEEGIHCLNRETEFIKKIGVTILRNVKVCIPGIQTLAELYNDDQMFCSKVEAFLVTIDTRIKSLVSLNPHLFDSEDLGDFEKQLLEGEKRLDRPPKERTPSSSSDNGKDIPQDSGGSPKGTPKPDRVPGPDV